jgi:hypothetical protein
MLLAYQRSNKYQFYSLWFDLIEASTLTITQPMLGFFIAEGITVST